MSTPRTRRWSPGWVAVVVAALLVTGGVYLRHLGYLGGPIYTIVRPARAQPRPLSGTVAVFFSGDMGFNTGMGPRIAGHLAEHGMTVIGVNSLAAFARRKTPGEISALVRDAAQQALAQPGARDVVLIGQSFGANILLYGAQHLPSALKRKVRAVELIVPGDSMLFRATPGGVFDFGHDGPALPVARRLTDLPVLCIHGETEPNSLCPLWRQPNVERVTLPGDHFLRGDNALVAATLLHGLAAVDAAPR